MAIAGFIPQNCTLGTSHLCIGSSDRCLGLPLKSSSLISVALSSLTARLPQSVEALGRSLEVIASQDFKKYCVFSIVITLRAIALGLVYLCSIWHEVLTFTCHVFGSTISAVALLRAFSALRA